MAKKFAHLTAQMKTEKRISRQLEVTTSGASTSGTSSGGLNPPSGSASTSSSSPRISSLQRSSSSGSSSHHHKNRDSPQRQGSFHSCRHRNTGLPPDSSTTSSPSQGSNQTHSRHFHHQHSSTSQETDLGGNDSSSSNSNQVNYISVWQEILFQVKVIFECSKDLTFKKFEIVRYTKRKKYFFYSKPLRFSFQEIES